MAAGLSRFWACAQVVSQMVGRRGVASLTGRDAQIPRSVKIVEVGPRDGLQNEKVSIELSIENYHIAPHTYICAVKCSSF